jgi:hypothetical protein
LVTKWQIIIRKTVVKQVTKPLRKFTTDKYVVYKWSDVSIVLHFGVGDFFILSDMFYVSEEYIEREYTISE